MGALLARILASVLGRWILGGVVALLLGSVAWKWYDFKQKLREAGMEECVQEINQATVDALETALADEKAANVALIASLLAAEAANQEAVARRDASESRLATLEQQMENQRNEDPTYREWSSGDLPAGVVDRLREAARGSSGNTN